MQYAQGSEKVVLTTSPYMPVSQPLSLNEDPEIRRTRKVLLIIVGVCLGLAVLGVVSSIVGSEAPIIFLSFGCLVAYRYSPTGLKVFAWLNVVGLVILGIGVIVCIFFGFVSLTVVASAANDRGQGIQVGVSIMVLLFVTIILIAAFILQIVIMKLAFKLARLIEAKKSLPHQQI
ncbi:unnamed protein product [Rotaria socialis]